ncbi:MAG: 50S ribosomal protein L11 methyltransferase [Lachnospiraceae bacterium]|nr:50S ribosomal protein L11 methyltransferase [Lachnospiraceae bacterium]
MKWTQYTLKTTTEATDMISYTLGELGVEGIEIEDNIPLTEFDKAQMFVDILPETAPDDGTATIRFYREPEENPEEFMQKVNAALDGLRSFMDIGEGLIEISETADKDWMNNWKEFFHSFRVSDRLVIKPEWEQDPAAACAGDSDIIINIDPGAAFGTGSHETTRLCILALEKYIKPGCNILDVGCGSGILSIVSIKYGASHALGIEIDEHAIPSTIDNRDINGITAEQFEIKCGNIIDDDGLQRETGFEKYDIAVANILANVIIPLSAEIGQHIKKGGLFISSGIIDTAADSVRKAISDGGFEIIDTTTLKDWYCFTARKK